MTFVEMAGRDGLVISTDAARLDIDRICAWLAASYWANERDRATIERSIANSLCFGAYASDGRQVALARVTTDLASFAWIADVVVDDAWRGKGIGTWLMGTVVDYLRQEGVPRLVLTTRDAHGVYERFGFTPLRVPATWMEIDLRRNRPDPSDVNLG
ncbi:MAG TPA: GNAT family N-acetyltransferase [Jatrophihabitans sp.]|nr:GNAT family N-acetyltransferase [Jatrophihabitans sp.]